MLSVRYGTYLCESNGPLGNSPSSKSIGYGTLTILLTIPEEKEGVKIGLMSARGTILSIMGNITIKIKIIITRTDVGLRNAELARKVIETNVVMTSIDKRKEEKISYGKSSYLDMVANEITM